MAASVSTRSAGDSPMPTSIPVVKATPSFPAALSEASLTSGVFVGAARWATRVASGLTVSIIMPIETL